jgi:hypothetical protein
VPEKTGLGQVLPPIEVEETNDLEAGNPTAQLLMLIQSTEEEHIFVDDFGAPRLRGRLDEETENIDLRSWPGE